MHIDVYCTGSDAEEDDSTDESSSTSPSLDNDRLLEDDSISTPQTVYDTGQFRLQHKRVDSNHDLPRRLGGYSADPPVATQPEATDLCRVVSPTNLREFLLSKSDTKQEVNESKQMLFNKHVGLSSGYNIRPGQRFNTRNRFRRDISDDCLSSNYPNSSQSTVRDFTCSSISSALASNAAINDDYDSLWKETDVDASVCPSSIAPSESFEYDNSRDRQRIRMMNERWGENHQWGSPERGRTWAQSSLTNFVEEDTRVLSKDTCEDFQIDQKPTYMAYGQVQSNAMPSRAASLSQSQAEMKEGGDKVYAQRLVITPSKPQTSNVVDDHPHAYDRQKRTMFYPIRHSASQSSSVLSRISGYTMEHLLKARRFGDVVPAIRKPGHHVGPAKNPDCQCDHCRRWFAQRDGCRERALSLGDSPFIQTKFWPGRHQ